MIEESLINYGVLGLWTLSLIYERFNYQKQIKQVIDRNTEALLTVTNTITKCKGVKHKW